MPIRGDRAAGLVPPENSAAIDFSTYIAERTIDFTGRAWVVEQIDAWLHDADAASTFIITGSPGIGKTALAAHLVRSRPQMVAAYHFCSARRGIWIDPVNFARSMARQLSLRFPHYAEQLLALEHVHIEAEQHVGSLAGGVAVNVLIDKLEVGTGDAAFNRLVWDPLHGLAQRPDTGTIVLLVDGLDESLAVGGASTIVDLLSRATDLPRGVRLILTSRDERRVLRHWDAIPHLRLHADEPKNLADVHAYTRSRLNRIVKETDAPFIRTDDLARRITAKSAGNFLYVAHLLNVMEERPDALGIIDALPEGLDGVYRMFLNSRDIGRDFVRWDSSYLPVLAVLAIAKEPLTEERIAAWTALDQQRVATVIRDVWEYLSQEPGTQPRYRLYHQSFVDFLLDPARSRDHAVDSPTWHRRVAAYYESDRFAEAVLPARVDEYAFQHLAHHLVEAGASTSLFALIEHTPWRQRKRALDPTGRAYAADVEFGIRAASRLGASGLPKLVAYALLHTRHIQPVAVLEAEFLGQLTVTGRHRQALDIVRLMAETRNAAAASAAIARALHQRGIVDEADQVWAASAALARSGASAATAARGLTDVAATLFECGHGEHGRALLAEASRLVEQVPGHENRTSLWCAIAMAFTAGGMTGDAEEALRAAAQDIAGMEHRLKHHGGGGHEDYPYDYYTGMYEKSAAIRLICETLLRLRDAPYCDRLLAELSPAVDGAASAVFAPRHSGARLSGGEEAVGGMRRTLDEARSRLGGWPVRARTTSQLFSASEAADALRAGKLDAAAYTADVALVIDAALRARAFDRIPAFVTCILDDASNASGLADAAVLCAEHGYGEEARALASRVLVPSDPSKPEGIDRLLERATAMIVAGEPSSASAVLEAVDEALRSTTRRTRDNEEQLTRVRVSKLWHRLGRDDRAADTLLALLSPEVLRHVSETRTEGLKRLDGSTVLQVAPSPEFDSAARPWDCPELARSALLYVVPDSLREALVNAMHPRSHGARAAAVAQLQVHFYSLAHRSERVAILLALLSCGEHATVLQLARAVDRDDERGRVLGLLAHRVAADEAHPDAMLERILDGTGEMWAGDDIAHVRTEVAVSLARLGRTERAWDVVRSIERNDQRADAVAAVFRQWADAGDTGTMVAQWHAGAAILDTLWSKIDTLRALVQIAALLTASDDPTHVREVLSRALTVVASIRRPEADPIDRILSADRPRLWAIWERDRAVERALATLVECGYARDALSLAAPLANFINVALAVRLMVGGALSAGDREAYQQLLRFAGDHSVRPAHLFEFSTLPSAPDLALRWLETAFSVAAFGQEEIFWEHLQGLAPLFRRIADDLPHQVHAAILGVEAFSQS